MSDEVMERTDKLADLITEVAFEQVTLIDIDAWQVGHIIAIMHELDAELQRRYDVEKEEELARTISRLH